MAINFLNNPRVGDNVKIEIGDSSDLQIYHDATQTFIDNQTGNLTIQNQTNDGDIIFKNDNGSGGIATYFYLDGGGAITRVSKNFRTDDNVQFQVGSGADGKFYHNGTNTVLENAAGGLIIQNAADNQDIFFKSDNGSGGVVTYFYLDGSLVNGSSILGATRFPDKSQIFLGTGGDMALYHDGSNSFISNGTGNITIENSQNDGDIIFRSDDGSGGTATYFFVDGGEEAVRFYKDTWHSDSKKAFFGTGKDLQIYHNGSNSFIQDVGTGFLAIDTNGTDVRITKSDSEYIAKFITDGAVELYYDSAKKFETTSSGISVSGDALIQDSSPQITLLDTTNNTDALIYSDDTGSLNISADENNEQASSAIKLFVDGGEKMRIDSSGRVGIGMTPSDYAGYMLQIDGDTQAFISIGNTTTGEGALNGLVIGNDATGADIYQREAQPLRFHTSNNERMRITSVGKVGIGTTSPASPLHIYQNGGDASTGAGITIEQDGTGDAVVQYLLTGNRRWVVGVDNSDSDRFKFSSSADLNSDTVVTINTHSAGGFVGIGTTAPVVPLHIVGTAINNPSNASGGYEVMQVFDDTSFATGVGGGIGFGGNFNSSNSTIFSEIRGLKENSTSGNYAGALSFSTRENGGNITEAMRIDSAGAVKFNAYDSTNNTGTPTYLLGTDGSGNIVKTLSTPGGIPAQHNLKSKAYTSLVGSPSSGSWFDIFTITDSMGPVNCKIFTYAHDALEFSVAEGYGPSNAGTITVINSVATANSGYATVSEVRIDQNGVVSIKLVWSSGPSVNIGINITGYNVPNLTSTLSVNTSTVTVVDSVNVDVTGIVRSRKQLRAGSNVLFDTGGDSYINGGNVGINTTNPTDKFQIDAPHSQLRLRDTDDATFTQFSSSGGKLAIRQDSTTASHFWMNSSGNVGIGMIPDDAVRLSVSGQIGTTNGTAAAPTHTFYGDDDTGMFRAAANNLAFSSGGSERMRIESDGTTILRASVKINTGADAANPRLYFQQDSLNVNNFIEVDRGTGAMEFYNNGSERMRITSDGRLGINTTSPGYKLHVNGNSLLGNSENISMSAGGAGQLRVAGNGYTGSIALDATAMHIYHNSSSRDLILGTNETARLTISGSSGDATFASDLYIPDQIIHSGDTNTYIQFHAADQFRVVTGGTERFEVNNTQVTANSEFIATADVGIGTTSPNTRLHVSSDAGFPQIRFQETGNSEAVGLRFQAKTGADAQVYADIKFDPDLSELVINNPYNSATQGLTVDSSSNVLVGNDLYVPDQIIHTGDTDTYMQFNAANTWRIVTGGTERMRVDSSGDVGIGVTSPEGKFHVVGPALGDSINNTSTDAVFQSANANQSLLSIQNYRTSAGTSWTSASKRLQMRIDSTHMGWMQFNGTGNNGGISWGAGSSTTQASVPEKMRITSAGRLGIGTTGPAELLEVAGNAMLDTSSARFKIKGGTTGTSSGIDWTFNSNTTQYAKIELDYDLRASTGLLIDSGYPMTLDYSSSRFAIRYNGTEQMRIETTGDVGINITNPNAKLHVDEPSTSANSLTYGAAAGQIFTNENSEFAFGLLNASPYPLYIQGRTHTNTARNITLQGLGGNIGIGTYSPSSLLHLSSASSPTIRIVDTTNSVTLLAFAQDSSAGFGTYSNHTLAFFSNSTERMRISTGGNVGIGTTSPTSKLHVSGNILSSSSTVSSALEAGNSLINTKNLNTGGTGSEQFYVAHSGADVFLGNARGTLTLATSSTSSAIRIESSGQVGIGTTSPGTVNGTAFGGVMLHVKGPSNIGRLVLEGAVQGTMLMNATGSTANKRLKFIQSKQNEFRMGKVSDSGTETTQLAIDDAGDVILQAAGKGLVLVAPGGATYRLSVTNDGELQTTQV